VSTPDRAYGQPHGGGSRTRALGPVEPASAERGRLDVDRDIAAAYAVELALPPALVEAIAERAAELVADRPAASPWLDVAEAAGYLRCRRQRVYDLVSAGRLRVAKDGTRSLFRREWLDAYLEPPEVSS
jgi:excisionase family DNA binding protein